MDIATYMGTTSVCLSSTEDTFRVSSTATWLHGHLWGSLAGVAGGGVELAVVLICEWQGMDE